MDKQFNTTTNQEYVDYLERGLITVDEFLRLETKAFDRNPSKADELLDTTKKVRRSEAEMQTEFDQAHEELRAAIRANDLPAVNAARIWLAKIQREQREARMLLMEHVSDQMKDGTQK